jgi:hypothetical protein
MKPLRAFVSQAIPQLNLPHGKKLWGVTSLAEIVGLTAATAAGSIATDVPTIIGVEVPARPETTLAVTAECCLKISN